MQALHASAIAATAISEGIHRSTDRRRYPHAIALDIYACLETLHLERLAIVAC